MENNFGTIRSVAFGGFNKQDVIAYIERVKNESYEYKTRTEKTVKELEAKVAELENAAAEALLEKEKLVKRIGELSISSGDGKSETIDEINEATNHLRTVADELCQSLRDFMERISENSYSVVIEGAEKEVEEEFDGAKFMAELEAEIYAKLGVEEAVKEGDSFDSEVSAETEEQFTAPEEITQAHEEEKKSDRVSSILSSVSSFSSSGETNSKEKKTEVKKDETVSNILGSLSFLK